MPRLVAWLKVGSSRLGPEATQNGQHRPLVIPNVHTAYTACLQPRFAVSQAVGDKETLRGTTRRTAWFHLWICGRAGDAKIPDQVCGSPNTIVLRISGLLRRFRLRNYDCRDGVQYTIRVVGLVVWTSIYWESRRVLGSASVLAARYIIRGALLHTCLTYLLRLALTNENGGYVSVT